MATIYIIGDSTVENGREPFFGWGGQLQAAIPGSAVANHAKGGRSTKSFWDEGLFAPVEAAMEAGDLLLIAFGHNDEKDDEARHTDPETTFPEMLTRYIEAARRKAAIPVLLTSVCRCYFTGDGSMMYTHGEYPRAVRTLAARLAVPLVDTKQLTRERMRAMGPEGAKAWFVHAEPGEYESLPEGWHDQTHYNLRGAREVAAMVAQGLAELDLL